MYVLGFTIGLLPLKFRRKIFILNLDEYTAYFDGGLFGLHVGDTEYQRYKLRQNMRWNLLLDWLITLWKVCTMTINHVYCIPNSHHLMLQIGVSTSCLHELPDLSTFENQGLMMQLEWPCHAAGCKLPFNAFIICWTLFPEEWERVKQKDRPWGIGL